jgi:hypothetical protein
MGTSGTGVSFYQKVTWGLTIVHRCRMTLFFFIFFFVNFQENRSLSNRHISKVTRVSKSKAFPLHAMEAHGGRGGIAPTHF